MSVNHSDRSGGIIGISFNFLQHEGMLCVPIRGDSNEYNTIFNINTRDHPKLSPICSYESFSKRLKNEFETAVVNECSSHWSSTVCFYMRGHQ